MNKYVSPVAEELKISVADIILASGEDCPKYTSDSEDTGDTNSLSLDTQSLV